MADIQVCPKCGGLDVGCSVCDAPPLRSPEMLATRGLTLDLSLDAQPATPTAPEIAWEVQGIDISAWNGRMRFDTGKYQFAIVRLGYGNGWKDSRCDEYRQGLIANDIPYGVYWYVKAGQDIALHANSFYQISREYPFQLAYTEDFEYTEKGKVETLNWIMSYDQRLKGLIGGAKRTRPYSNANFWNGSVAPNTYFTQEHFVANWSLASVPYMPVGWTWNEGDDWQWSADNNGKAVEYGMVSDGDPDMDLIRYYGSCASFNTRNGTHIVPIGQTPPPPTLPAWFYTLGALNIRSSPDSRPTAANIIGSTKLNTRWKPNAVVSGFDDFGHAAEWWRINEWAYVAKWRTQW